MTANPNTPEFETVDDLLKSLISNTGEEYHKLHSGKEGFPLANARMNFYENKFKKSLKQSMRLMMEDIVDPKHDPEMHMHKGKDVGCLPGCPKWDRGDINRQLKRLDQALTKFCGEE